jgi:hypothetical protein
VLNGTSPTFLAAPTAPERAIADRRGYVSIHRFVASEQLGRWVTRGEAVVVIDGDPWNWHPSNLRVRPLAASLPKARRGQKPARLSPPAKFRSKAKPGAGSSPPATSSRRTGRQRVTPPKAR